MSVKHIDSLEYRLLKGALFASLVLSIILLYSNKRRKEKKKLTSGRLALVAGT